jgi:hypothetical protein
MKGVAMATDNSAAQEAPTTEQVVYILFHKGSSGMSKVVQGVTLSEDVAHRWTQAYRAGRSSSETYEPFRLVTSVADVEVAREERRLAEEIARYERQRNQLSPAAKAALNLA